MSKRVKVETEGHCCHCGRKLREGKAVSLEFNLATQEWHRDDGSVPAEDSQGCWDFGPDCAGQIVAGEVWPALWGKH